jgi:hypothetical protein
MFISTSQEFLETNFSSSKRTSKNNLLAILFFFLGVPNIYAVIQKGRSQGKSLKMKSNKGLYLDQTSNIFSRFSPGRYLSILLLGVFTAGIMEMVRAIAK